LFLDLVEAGMAVDLEVRFCARCGAPVTVEEHFGKLRPACQACGWIYFADPKVAAAALIQRNGQVLLVRRANDPQRGLWTLPAGFVDAGEDPRTAVERECLEETGLQVRVMGLQDVLYGREHSRGAHILIVYRAEILSGALVAGDDVDRAAFFAIDALPPLAFSTTEKILKIAGA
jgi:ADP-ribose pyrophosphatase YjhB (NUDIX family)